MLPLDSTTNENVLLVTGLINLGALTVSSAFYNEIDGWTPYLVTSQAVGDNNSFSLKGLFSMDEPYLTPKQVPPNTTPPIIPHAMTDKKQMAVPLVILISIAISLGIVFLLVLLAMSIVYFKRKTGQKAIPQIKPPRYYNKTPDSPDAILAMLKEKTPNDFKEKGELTQLHNMTKPDDQSFLSFVPIAAVSSATRRAPLPPTHTYRQSHSYRSIFGSLSRKTGSFNNIGAAIIKTKTTSSSGSFSKPLTDAHHASNISSFYSNEYTNRQMTESPTSFHRSSEIGIAIKEGNNRSTVTTTNIFTNNPSQSNVHHSNIPTPTSAVSSQSEDVRWTTTPVANMSTAVVNLYR
jgi:hypothetical protein